MKLVRFFLILSFLFLSSDAATSKWLVGTGETLDTLSAIQLDGSEYISITSAATAIGLEAKSDPLNGIASVSDQESRAEFHAGSSFCKCDEDVVRLSHSVKRSGTRIFISCEDIPNIFPMISGDSVFAKPLDLPVSDSVKQSSAVTDSVKPAKAISHQQTKTTAVEKKTDDDPPAEPTDKNPVHIKTSVKTVVIDPGHGGMDPGAIGVSGVQEKDIVLSIGTMLRSMIKSKSSIKVLMTRDKDIFIPLRDRTKFANDHKADLFISIHANSIGRTTAKDDNPEGFRVYFLSQAKNEDDKRVAMFENTVVELENKDKKKRSHIDNILFDMANNEHLSESQDFSIAVADEMAGTSTRYGKGVGQANFWVLNGAWMPSVLVETGFVSNKAEEKQLATASYQRKLASAMCNAVLKFKKK